ncbi:MAG: glycosyl hydrolase family 8 [Fibrobacter sp.]|nr:glycosyl hydrolase family 8 [Fibrobacter sp.]
MERYKPRDLFVEAGYGPNFANQLIQNGYSKLFEGDPIDERVCFDASEDMSYIVDIGHDDIRSEGMSYGMYITALTGHERQFDKLWNFTKRFLRNTSGPHEGYFAWQVSTADFSMMDPGAAPDGEEYFAMALLIAAEKFNRPELKKEAVDLINWMLHKPDNDEVRSMFDPERKMVRFSPVQGNDFTDPSYHTIAFYRAFAEATGDDTWNEIAAQSIRYINKAAHYETGLCSEYSEFDGTPRATPWYPESNCFSGDAWRVAMNLSLDYALFRGDKSEKDICERLLFFFESRRPYLADYAVDGSDFPRLGREATPGVIAMNAAAAQVLDPGDELIKPFVKNLAALSVPSYLWRYYDGMLYMIGLLATSGKITF